MKTYQEVADAILTDDVKKAKFIAYMTIRWADSEEIKCLTGYAEEWANRFLSGSELYSSDSEGKEVLKSIDRDSKNE